MKKILKQPISKSKFLSFILLGNMIAFLLVIYIIIFKMQTVNLVTLIGSLAVLSSFNIMYFPLFKYCIIDDNKFIVKNLILNNLSEEYFYEDIKKVILNYNMSIQIEFILKEEKSNRKNTNKHSLFLTPKKDLMTIIKTFEEKKVETIYINIDKKHLV